MKDALHIKFIAVAVIFFYVLSSVGINVHSCRCDGTVSVSIAGGHCCAHEHACSHHSFDCCTDTVLKIVITGCDSPDFNIKVPASAALPSFICPGQEIFEEQFFHRVPERFVLLSGKEVLRDNCVLRV